MAKLLLAVVLALFVATIEAAPDAACGTAQNPTTCAATEFCEGNTICKIKLGQACVANAATCVDGLSCPAAAPLVCTCATTETPNADNTLCLTKVGQSCPGGAGTSCVGGTCTASLCACPTGKTANTAGTECSGAAFVAASFLSMVAMFVTTRLL